MTGNRRLLLGGAAVALGFAALVAVAPDLVPVSRSALVDGMTTLSGVVGLGGLALVAGAIAVFQGVLSSETPASPPALPVETGTDDSTDTDSTPPRDGVDTDDEPSRPRIPGADFDARLASVGRVGGSAVAAEERVRADLRRLAIDVYQEVARCDWETAARAVDDGRWTDDVGAAAFVGGPDAPTVPLRLWFRAVISDDGAFRAQTTRTIRAIYDLRERDPDDLDERDPEDLAGEVAET